MKYVPLAMTLAIALTTLCAGSAQAGLKKLTAFQAGGDTAEWANRSGQLVLVLVGSTVAVDDRACGAETENGAWLNRSPLPLEFDLNCRAADSVNVYVEGTITDQFHNTRPAGLYITVQTVRTGFRHVTLSPDDFSGELKNGNTFAMNDSTAVYFKGLGKSNLKSFLVNGLGFKINLNTESHIPDLLNSPTVERIHAGTRSF